MNIIYHYYATKTLARKAGFDEKTAQLLAHFSQMIDDFILPGIVVLNNPQEVPPDFFVSNHYAAPLGADAYAFQLLPTGIDFVQSLNESYRKHTLSPFHFVPAKTLAECTSSRADYRAVAASSPSATLINRLVSEKVSAAKAEKSRANLIALGMAIHSYADTFAHCNFSGQLGWENESFIKNVSIAPDISDFGAIDLIPPIEAAEIYFFKSMPPIGHANVGYFPDYSCLFIDYALKNAENDFSHSIEVSRSNADFYETPSRNILNFFRDVLGNSPVSDAEWQTIWTPLRNAQSVTRLVRPIVKQIFGKYFPDIDYNYDENEYFNISASLLGNTSGILPQTLNSIKNIFDTEGRKASTGRLLSIDGSGMDVFFEFQQAAHKWSDDVTGATVPPIEDYRAGLPQIKQVYSREMNNVLKPVALRVNQQVTPYQGLITTQNPSPQPRPTPIEPSVPQPQPTPIQPSVPQPQPTPIQPSVPQPTPIEPPVPQPQPPKEEWKPTSTLAQLVLSAGFTYEPEQDIIKSTHENVQRTLGYCKLYDQTAVFINSLIDCEPIIFTYGEYEYMLELWKGQYGIETGGEIGLYYRVADEPLTESERTLTGKLFKCVPDDMMINMAFTLYRKGKEFMKRGPEPSWWLTGFHWGFFSEPKQLVMNAA
ncbi:MAG: DUF4474 domain-containing protein, partial [Clostridiales bacterium]|nr:DUF4474 domain-containing protein [Clostridiales bacterium]